MLRLRWGEACGGEPQALLETCKIAVETGGLRRMTHDRMPSDRFPLTQAGLAIMLSVRRLSVSEAEAHFRRAGLIRYSRGIVTVLNRNGLEGEACECYRRVKDYFDRLLCTANAL